MNGWKHPVNGRWMPNTTYKPGQLLRCVGPWFHEQPPENGHTLYDPVERFIADQKFIRTVRNSVIVPQGYPLIYLGVWIDSKYYLVYSAWGVKAITCYTVVSNEQFYELIKDKKIDIETCMGGSKAYIMGA